MCGRDTCEELVKALLTALSLGAPALAGTIAVTGGVASGQTGNGTMSAAASAAMNQGPLPASDADVAAKPPPTRLPTQRWRACADDPDGT